jgi:serine/threonine-protein kinase
MKLAQGQRFGQWTLTGEKPLGEGGSGVVWQASNSNGKIAAIKFLESRHFGRQREKRFRHEVEFLKKETNRPGILPLIDSYLPIASSVDDRPWHVTPLAECFTKLELAGLKLPDLVAKIEIIAQTLAKLHDENKWHRDLKPENLFMLDNHPVIGDFGLVDFPGKEAITTPEDFLGARNYIAPEMTE